MLRQITSLQHPLVKHIVRLRQNRDYRHEYQSVIVEGEKPVAEVGKHCLVKTILVYDESMIPAGVHANEVLIVDEQLMQKVSGMCSPEGIVAEVEMPRPASLQGLKRVVALDAVADPGNVGALLRTALAMGWEGAFLIGDGCDPFNEKALRAARGATFRLPLRMGSWEELQALAGENKWTSLAADLEGESPSSFRESEGTLLVLGNESHGLSETALRFCRKVTIPMSGKMESLNVAVAGGILMYALNSTIKESYE